MISLICYPLCTEQLCIMVICKWCAGVKNLPWQFPSASNRFVGDQAVGYVNSTVGAQFQIGGLALVDPTSGVATTQVWLGLCCCQKAYC